MIDVAFPVAPCFTDYDVTMHVVPLAVVVLGEVIIIALVRFIEGARRFKKVILGKVLRRNKSLTSCTRPHRQVIAELFDGDESRRHGPVVGC